MLAILNKELRSYFKSPAAYIFITFFLLWSGILFATYNVLSFNPDYSLVIKNLTIFLMLGVPILTMRMLSEERKQRTDQLILTAPVHTWEYILGKYLSGVILFAIAVVITFIHPFILSFFGPLPTAQIIGTYLGYFFIGAAYISIGLFISSLTESQIAAGIGTLGVIILSMLINAAGQMLPDDRIASLVFIGVIIALTAWGIYYVLRSFLPSLIVIGAGAAAVVIIYIVNRAIYDGLLEKVVKWFSLTDRYGDFSLGIFDVSAIVYFITFSAFFVFLTIQTIEKRRWS